MRSLAFVFALSACGVPDSPDDPEALSEEDAIVRVSSCGEAPMHYAKHFDIIETDAVYFVADLTASKGTHTAAFEVWDPLGNPYQRTTTNFTIVEKTARAMGSMPVNGTWISQYNLVGKWTCHVYVDAAPTEAAHVAFILR